jgi:hypothetical protein
MPSILYYQSDVSVEGRSLRQPPAVRAAPCRRLCAPRTLCCALPRTRLPAQQDILTGGGEAGADAAADASGAQPLPLPDPGRRRADAAARLRAAFSGGMLGIDIFEARSGLALCSTLLCIVLGIEELNVC